MARKRPDQPTIVKKYANRRLYDTGRSSYVTLEDLYEMVKEGHDFVVQDAKTGEDLTKQVLTQIIVEKESNGNDMLPVNFLKQLIGFYGDKMQGVLPNYLEQSMENFHANQEKLREQINKSFGGIFPLQAFEELNKQNIAMMENAMKAMAAFTQGNMQKKPTDKS